MKSASSASPLAVTFTRQSTSPSNCAPKATLVIEAQTKFFLQHGVAVIAAGSDAGPHDFTPAAIAELLVGSDRHGGSGSEHFLAAVAVGVDITAGLGTRWLVTEVSTKPWPCGRASHGALCVLANLQNVARIEAHVSPLVIRLVSRP